MKIASWNVNSLRVRLPHVLQWLERHQPDVLGLQETKLPDHDFPADAFVEAGYQVRFVGQKTYNGVALIYRPQTAGEPTDLQTRLSHFDDSQKRLIAATFNDTRIYNLYIPNGQSVGSEKYEYKMQWLAALRQQLEQELATHKRVIAMGDFNIAPKDRDIHDPDRWRGKIMCSDAEREQLAAIQSLGLQDVFRVLSDATDEFSWWDYRMGAFNRNNGLRIDLILASGELADNCNVCEIDKDPRALERPSDHAPVWANFDQ